MNHELKFLWQYVLVLSKGLYEVYSRSAKTAWQMIHRLPLFEKIFFLLLVIELFFSLRHWKSYEFLANDTLLVHGIYSDDFVYFLLLCGIGLLGIIRYAAWAIERPVMLILLKIVRFTSLGGMSFYYLLNLFSSERIAPAPEAEFTLWFVLYGLNLVFLWITGVLGLVMTPPMNAGGQGQNGFTRR